MFSTKWTHTKNIKIAVARSRWIRIYTWLVIWLCEIVFFLFCFVLYIDFYAIDMCTLLRNIQWAQLFEMKSVRFFYRPTNCFSINYSPSNATKCYTEVISFRFNPQTRTWRKERKIVRVKGKEIYTITENYKKEKRIWNPFNGFLHLIHL